MQEHEKGLLSLMIIGALIALGKALSSGEHITPSLFIGRIILGSAVSVEAVAILIWIPDINPLALSGAGPRWELRAIRLLRFGSGAREMACYQEKEAQNDIERKTAVVHAIDCPADRLGRAARLW